MSMLRLTTCRELIGKDSGLSDAELDALRESVHRLAEMLVESYLQTKNHAQKNQENPS